MTRTLITAIIVSIIIISCINSDGDGIYYVDPIKGMDNNPGTLSRPFKTLDKALFTVAGRVNSGIKSDKIYLRAGVYRKESINTLWTLNLKGTADDFSLLSAMPSEPNAEGAVQRKSGKWYEHVIFDDAQVINTKWVQDSRYPGVWKTKPGYTNHEWIHTNLWPWTNTVGYPLTREDSTPNTTSFTLGPYMLVQDNEPFIWMDSPKALISSGHHTYDHSTDTLYIYPFEGKDPNSCKIESWYGGPEYYEEGILYLDGEGRAMFKGNMEYAGITGCEFRMIARLFEFQRRGYEKEEEREIQCHVIIEDNVFEHGWTHFLLDANTIYVEDDNLIKPRFPDRSDWHVKNNVFFRPSREIFQVHGANHIFEYNEVIDHTGPWAGPAVCVGTTNPRNMKNYTVRNNYINGNGNTKYSSGTFLVVEVGGGLHIDEKGDYINGPIFIENNLITNFTNGQFFLLGKGNVRLSNVTIRNNILGNSLGNNVISIGNPQKNLIVENNLFYQNKQVLTVSGSGNPMENPPLPSFVSFRNNMFVGNKALIDKRLFDSPPGSIITFDNNLFCNNSESAIGSNAMKVSVEFMDPENFDFRIKSSNADEIYKMKIGPYKSNDSIPEDMHWWVIYKNARKALKPGLQNP
jgi:hypothetical protein